MIKSTDNIEAMIHSLSLNKYGGYRKDFIYTWDKCLSDLKAVLNVATVLKELYGRNLSLKTFQSGMAVSIFRDNSTRTRLAFSSACNLLGLVNQEVDEQKSQIAHGETVRETANMISFLTEIIGIRDDKYIGIGCDFIKEMGLALDEGYKDGVLNNRPTIINLQDDLDHPTQTLSDLLHILDYFDGYENLKNKKVVMSWAYSPSYGKPLSVPQGIVGLLSRLGMNVVLAHPEGYELKTDIIEKAKQFASTSGGSFEITHDMNQAFKNANIVYPKSWAPYKVMEERTNFLLKKDDKSLEKLEKECLNHNLKYQNWICDEKLMSGTKEGNALYLHCLPADISGVNCQNGEVTKGVFEKYRVDTYKEAKNKAFIIASIILLSCFNKPFSLLENIYETRVYRKYTYL